ncbi:AFR036Cp [Eremothecium gossypii ATCC 10895]|uniref:AFR036Cp n=1 Tax=Eremothecium gossypii (strain ATCC 10895 / CBS 109.51 / FGSC 9923 / NRRL Y-1056) TaxID=284811 RepID=Q754N6_EREGS|nr:AFR036Cp [Eremothecium gossypii ATCC 10895]AAS53407.1 AFR036Cp [Eremothecium gossypii ATCC 10895]AEY97718.1 FAFR036Cp [Eremothecium gossypii FDAG1]
MSVLSLIINSASLVLTSWGVSNAVKLTLPPNLQLAGQKQFLTILGASLTIVTNVIGIGYSLLGGDGGLRYVSREVFLPAALVLESVVALVYWPLRVFFVNMIYHGLPEGASPEITVPVDLCIHLVPVAGLLLDYFLVQQGPFQMGRLPFWLLVTAMGVGYNRWLGHIIHADLDQSYPYPFLDVAEPYRTLIFGVITTIAWGFYVLYQTLHGPAAGGGVGKQKLS